MKSSYAPRRREGKRTQFKRKNWKKQIKEMLGDNFLGFVESGDDVEVLTKNDVNQADRDSIQLILDRI